MSQLTTEWYAVFPKPVMGAHPQNCLDVRKLNIRNGTRTREEGRARPPKTVTLDRWPKETFLRWLSVPPRPSVAVDLEQVLELDSLEYLEALECVTERLESRVNFCKAHLMMVTCFDVTSRRR
jgi:hypothetical protein